MARKVRFRSPYRLFPAQYGRQEVVVIPSSSGFFRGCLSQKIQGDRKKPPKADILTDQAAQIIHRKGIDRTLPQFMNSTHQGRCFGRRVRPDLSFQFFNGFLSVKKTRKQRKPLSIIQLAISD